VRESNTLQPGHSRSPSRSDNAAMTIHDNWLRGRNSNPCLRVFSAPLHHLSYPAKLVDPERIELSSPRCKRGILPLNDRPILQMVAEVRLERTSLAYETKLEPPPVYSAVKLRKNWFRQMESNHLPIGNRPIALPVSFAGMEPGVRVELTSPVDGTGAWTGDPALHQCAAPPRYSSQR
jgi:hypothetical protein